MSTPERIGPVVRALASRRSSTGGCSRSDECRRYAGGSSSDPWSAGWHARPGRSTRGPGSRVRTAHDLDRARVERSRAERAGRRAHSPCRAGSSSTARPCWQVRRPHPRQLAAARRRAVAALAARPRAPHGRGRGLVVPRATSAATPRTGSTGPTTTSRATSRTSTRRRGGVRPLRSGVPARRRRRPRASRSRPRSAASAAAPSSTCAGSTST